MKNILLCFRSIGFYLFSTFFQSDVKFRRDVHEMQPEANKYEFMMGFNPVYMNFERKIHFILKL